MITSLRKTQFLTQKVTNTEHELLAGGLQDSHESVSQSHWLDEAPPQSKGVPRAPGQSRLPGLGY